MREINENLQILDWDDIRTGVLAVNPRLAELIDEVSPGQDLDFVKAKYHFGQPIMRNGHIHLPISNNETALLTDAIIPQEIKARLDYSYVPVALILSKKAEVYYESEDRIMPTKIFNSGSMFGLWEMFDPPPDAFVKHVWSIVAGARSLFMLPKISNQFAHKRLQNKYKIISHAPNNILHHHEVFAELAKSPNLDCDWEMDILYFTKKWQELNKETNLNGLKLHHYLIQEAWRQSSNCRNNMSFDMAWELFSKAVTKRNMKPKPLIVNTLKHLLTISDGYYPGYAPAIDENAAPISMLQDVYSSIYKLNASPIIMEPLHLSKTNRPVYYSLQLPTLLEYAPGSHGKNIITDFRELKILFDMLKNTLNEAEKEFNFFHSEEDESLNIYGTEKLPEKDENFNLLHNAGFAKSSPFLKGCVQIKLKNNRKSPLLVDAVF